MKGNKLGNTLKTVFTFLACLIAAFFIWLYFNMDGESAAEALSVFRGL